MKKLIFILTLFLIFINTVFAAGQKYTVSEYKVLTEDGFNINATLKYPKVKGQKEFKTVVLLHSLGYNSNWWETLPDELLEQGYAIVTIDLRGHGKSVYNNKLVRQSWKNLTHNAYAKYPSDVKAVISHIKKENKRIFFDNWALVGSDIGAGAGICAISSLDSKPKTIVMLSPVVNAKGIYVPVKMAELSGVDIFAISGTGDLASINAQEYLSKFAQNTFTTYISPSRSNGQLLLKNDASLSKVITAWISQYLE